MCKLAYKNYIGQLLCCRFCRKDMFRNLTFLRRYRWLSHRRIRAESRFWGCRRIFRLCRFDQKYMFRSLTFLRSHRWLSRNISRAESRFWGCRPYLHLYYRYLCKFYRFDRYKLLCMKCSRFGRAFELCSDSKAKSLKV